jgi:TrmH family RNA methyltransferase
MGAIFTVSLAHVSDIADLPGQRIALVAGTGEPLRGPEDAGAGEPLRGSGDSGADTGLGDGERGADGAVTLLVGSERDGLPDELVAACERVASIPIATDSLNAAMAATVALYELTRRPHRCPARPNDTVPAS